MENRIVFREVLTQIKTAADASNGVISKDEIRKALSDLPLEEEHFSLIYEYLGQQDIRIVESAEEKEELPEEEERKSLSLYLDELMKLENTEDEHALLQQVMEGNSQARAHLIESYLPIVCEMAGEYEGEEIPAEDLIQEGNLGLLESLDALGSFDSPAACRAHILNSISKAMERAIRDGEDERKMGNGIAGRVNHLNEAVHNLEQDLEHKVSAEELSVYLEMPLEEIKDLLRMSGDQIEIEE